MMNIRKVILDALGLHKSMAMGGELPSDASNAMYEEAVKATKALDDMAIEAMMAVDVINGDIDSRYHDLGYYDANQLEQLPLPQLVFTYGGTWCSVTFEDWPIWCSENEGIMYDDDDNQLPLEPYFRKEVAARLKVMREMPF